MSGLDSRDVQALGWTLLHFVWQGAAVAVLLAALLRVLRHASAQVRYFLASMALVAMLVLPAATFGLVRPPNAAPVEVSTGATTECHDTIAATEAGGGGGFAAPELRGNVERTLPVLVGLWGLGVFALSLRTLGGWALVQRLKRSGTKAPPAAIQSSLDRLVAALRVTAPVRLYESALVQVPTVLGWLRPVVLVPASALTGLTTEQLELILAHELAHIRRRDYLVNLAQTAAETVLFYHPAVWWVSHRMRVEREHCCDDLAVAACGSPVRYARALADLEGLCARPKAPALAVAATGGSLLERVARLVTPPRHLSRASRGLAALLVAGSLTLALGVASAVLGTGPMPVAAAAYVQTPQPDEEDEITPAPAAVPLPPVPPVLKVAPTPRAAPIPTVAPVASAQATPAPEAAPATPATPATEPRAFPLDRILAMARAGVTPEYIDELEALGFGSLSAEQLMALKHQGVSAEGIEALAEAGYANLSIDQLVALRSQGVSAEYLREMKAAGLGDLSLSDALNLRAQGVSPDFIAEMKQAGYADLSVSKLLALRNQGVSAQYVTELQALGYQDLATGKLLALRAQGITPEYVRELKALGYDTIDVGKLIALRAQGVTPEYVRALRDAGLTDLRLNTLIALRAAGVTPEFVREMKDAGLDPLSAADLIQLRNSGVHPDLVKRLRGRQ